MWSAHKERTANELVLCNMLTESLGIIIVWYSFMQSDLFIQSLVQMEVSIFCLTKFDEIYKCLAE